MNELEKLYAFTEVEQNQIVQLKRLFERIDGDAAFRKAVNENNITPAQWDRLRSIGLDFAPPDIAFLGEIPDKVCKYVTEMLVNSYEQLEPEMLEAARRYPLLKLWGRYLQENSRSFTCECETMPDSSNKKFAAWRQRRIAAVKSELGSCGYIISHPGLAFELSEGCSVGCWFCSFAADKLKGYLDYHTRRDYFRRIVWYCVDILGREQVAMAVPYHSTEPYDNPSYIDFLKEYEEITGAVLFTSTARGNNIAWVRQLLEYYRKGSYPRFRLSVLSLAMLNKIHANFSPMELRNVELFMQMKDHPREKVAGGRLLKEIDGLRGEQDLTSKQELKIPQGSIACVSGFCINLVNKSVTLTSPCYTCRKWPYGFRVFDKATFNDENDFSQVIQAMIERNMPLSPPKDKPLRFRDDMVFRSTEDGFDLLTPNQIHHFKVKGKCGPLGELIAAGDNTYAMVTEQLVKEHGINPLIIMKAVQKLFDRGFLDELVNERNEQI